ncbi:DUF726-domain-containing protein [Xylariaceae sp. FL0594]|nr:DUF726-domain-containing protein [Xylariaceae sp. FL0594]
MPRHMHPGRPTGPKRPEMDLSTMLNTEQMKQLQVLMGAIMDEIQMQIRDNFDKLTVKEVEPTEGIAAPKPALTIPKTPEEALANSKKSEVELIVTNLTELKRDALAHFGKWRGLVQKRLQDIVVKNGGTGELVVRQGSQHAPVPLTNGEASNAQHTQQYPPMYTALRILPKEKRALILHTMLLLLLGLDQYSTYSRVALLKLATALGVPTFVLMQDEYRVSQALAQIIKGISAEEVAQKRAELGKPPKRWRSGGGVYNPASNAISDVLADPLITAGVGTVFGGMGVSTSVTAILLGGIGAATSTVPVGTLFGLYGARQGGKTMDAYAKDIQDFALIPLHSALRAELQDPKDVPAEDRRMRVTIGISGMWKEERDLQDQWKIIGKATEAYALRWELEALTKFSSALRTMTKSTAWSLAQKDIVGENVFTSLKTSYWPESLIKASKIMDNPWTVAMVRAEKTGLVLAEILNNKVQGERAVSLIGYGLGAKVIYACLTCLSEKRAFGIVDNVILFGAPCPSEVRVWAAMKSVVTGRLINVYSKNDYLLGFMYRTCAWTYGIAGLQPVEGVPLVENVDLSDYISNHGDYEDYVSSVLERVRWEDVDVNEVAKDLPKRPLDPVVGPVQVGKPTAAAPTVPVVSVMAEPRARNGNVGRDRKVDQKRGLKPPNKQSAGKGEIKNDSMPKPTTGGAKQPGGLQNGFTQPAGPKPRYKHNRGENQRPRP